MKKYISIFLSILIFISLTACKSNIIEPNNTINTYEENSNTQQIVESQVSSENDETTFELIDKSYNDLTSDEIEQLKYYNDGYTFIGDILCNTNEKWCLYKYGQLFKVIDTEDFINNEKERYKKYHLNSTKINNYVVINDCLYFFVPEAKDVYKIDFDNLIIQKYVDGTQFEEYAVYNNSVMFKHNDNLLFVCTCEGWDNVVEIDTTKDNPILEYKGKSDTFIKPGYKWSHFNFIPIDNDNYRITEYGYDIVNKLSSFMSYNFSLNDYKITDFEEFPNIEFDFGEEYKYVHFNRERSLGYFYRDDKVILYSYNNKEHINEISGKSELSSSILKSDSDKNKEFVCEDLPLFSSWIDKTEYKESTLNRSKLSNEWFYFRADGHGLIYYFDNDSLCDIGDYSVEDVDLWNIYYKERIDNSVVYSSKAIIDFKNNLYQGEEQ